MRRFVCLIHRKISYTEGWHMRALLSPCFNRKLTYSLGFSQCKSHAVISRRGTTTRVYRSSYESSYYKSGIKSFHHWLLRSRLCTPSKAFYLEKHFLNWSNIKTCRSSLTKNKLVQMDADFDCILRKYWQFFSILLVTCEKFTIRTPPAIEWNCVNRNIRLSINLLVYGVINIHVYVERLCRNFVRNYKRGIDCDILLFQEKERFMFE